ncbi:polymorphic outer membrane protein [Treponema socranskii subsp. paredis ATCC 35535]|nr:polymorphic outer membrane protein [Treponema socranskii subsp. paredis ATCC 35535]
MKRSDKNFIRAAVCAAGIVLLFSVTACKELLADIEEDFSYWASEPVITGFRAASPVSVNAAGVQCVPSASPAVLTFTVRNPKNFSFIMPGMPGSPTDIISFGSGISASQGTDYTLVQSTRDTLTLTYTSAFLERYEYGNGNIGAAIKLYSTDGRKFNRIYKFDLEANTVPVLEYAGIGKTQVGSEWFYVLLFRVKDMDTMIGSPAESVHKDIDTMNVTAGGVSLSPITLSVTGSDFATGGDLLAPLAVQKLKSTDPDLSGSGLLRLKTDVKVGGPTKRYAVSVKDTQGLRSNLIEANTDTTRLDPVKLFDDSSVSAAQITGTTAGAPKVFADMNGKSLEARVSPDGVGITGKIYKKNGGNWTETDTVSGTTTAAINLPALGSSEEAVYKITLKAHLTGYDDSDETEFYVNLLRLEPPVLKIRQNFADSNAALHSISAGSAGYVSEDIIPDANSYVAATPLVIYNAAGKVELSLTVPAGVTAKYKVGSGSEQSGSSIALNVPGPYTLKVWAEKGGAVIDSPEFHIQVINSVDTYERLKNLVQNTPARGTGQGQYNYSNSIDIKIGGDLSASSADTEIAVTGGKKLMLSSGTVRIIDANNSGRIFKISGSNSELELLNIKLTGGDAADGNGGAVCVEAGGTLDLFGSTVITPSTGSDINTQGKNDVYLANGTSIKLDATLLGAAPIARITPQGYNNGNTVLTGTAVGTEYLKFSVTQRKDSEHVWKIGSSGNLISVSSVINGTDPNAWKKLKEAVQNSPEGSIITINGEIKATNALNNSGEIVINGTVTIKGKTGAGSDILNANSTGTSAPTTKHRIFKVQSGKTLMLENLTLKGGEASEAGEAGFGGAIFVKGGALAMTNCTLTDNTATRGGGIAFKDGKGMTLTNCKIKENEVTNGDGGGISFETGTYTSEYTITGGEISENKVIMTDSVNQYSGGGIAVGNLGINITIDGCTIKDNRIRGASGKNPRGAGMWFGLGVNCTIKGNTTIENNKAHETGNEANLIGQGGGIQVDSGTLRIEDNTEIIGNGAKSGGGIYVQGGVITLIGSAVVTPSSGSDEDKPGKNDVYLGNGRTIKIVDILTGTAPVARITVADDKYKPMTQVLEGDIRYGQPKNYTKFTVTPKGSQKWEVDMDGFLQKTPVVINGSDSGAWQKLKAAVTAAADGDVITVNGEIKATNDSGNSGEIVINKDLTIQGKTGAGSDILNANGDVLEYSNSHRIFKVTDGKTLTLEKLTLKGGKAEKASSGNLNASGGGILLESGIVSLSHVTVSDCKAITTAGNKGQGGGIYVKSGTLTMDNSILSANTASESGGGVYVGNTGTFEMQGSSCITPSSGSDKDKPGQNDVYLEGDRKIKIVNILTATAPVARITVAAANYGVATQVLEGDITNGQPENYTKFIVTPKGSEKWEINSTGCLQKTPVVINGSDSGAWQKLKDAVAAAAAGDTITVRGSVKATNASGNFGEIEINKNLTIRGETGANSDILDANSGNLGSNARRIFSVTSGTLKLSGLTLKGGKAAAGANGGGVYVSNSGAAELSDCVIENCTADVGGGIGASGTAKLTNTSIKTCVAASTSKGGGAVYAKGCTVELEGCTLTGNKANDGGAIYVYGAIVNITNCTLTRNTAEKNGGAVYAAKDGSFVSTVTIKGGTIGGTGTDANTVTDPYGFGGGIYINDDCTLKLEKYMGNGVRIIGNKAGRAGGVRANNSTVIMTGCTFSDNSATDGTPLGGGGGVYTHKGTLSMTNCTLTHNTAIKGGGVILEGTNTTMSNCTLTRNEAENGGAIYVKKTDDGIASNVIIAGGTIGGTAGTDANKATGSNGSGGGIYVGEHCGLNLQDSTGTGAQSLRIIGNQAAKGKGVYAKNTIVAMKDRAQVHENNDVYLDSGSKIRADSVLNPPGGTAACITVPDDKYNTGTQVLLAGTGVTLANEAGKFTVTPKIVGGTTQQWQVNNTGYLQPK